MTDATAEFFNGLDRRRYEPRLENVSGTLRFDIRHGHSIDYWLVEIKDGVVDVSREKRDANSRVEADKAILTASPAVRPHRRRRGYAMK